MAGEQEPKGNEQQGQEQQNQQPGGSVGPITWDTLKAQIPEEIRGEKVWESVKDFGGLAKTFVEGQKLIGSSVRVPKEDAPKEVWDAFHKKLGRPESVQGYDTVPLPEIKGDKWDDELIAHFKKNAYDIGMTPRQYQSSVRAFAEIAERRMAARQAATEKATEALRAEWGAAYNNNLTFAKAAAQQIFGDEGVLALDRSGLGNDPVILKGLIRIGKELAEDGAITLGENFTSPRSAQDEINRVMNLSKEEREKHPYWNNKLEGHREAVDEMYRLQEIVANTA